MSIINFEDLIIQMMPFSTELIEWCKHHPEFQAALKIIYSDRFITLGAIVTSYSPNYPNDEVIGVYSYDYKLKMPLFKQDFIINIGKRDNEFVLYTRNPKGNSKYVKDISIFYQTYGKGAFYINSHHLSLEELPSEIRERGLQAIGLANRIQRLGGFIKPNQAHIDKIHKSLHAHKREQWFNKKKLN